MPDGPVSFAGRRALRAAVNHPRRPSTLLPGDLADLLLDGEHSPHPVATLLAAARGPATAHELSGEAAARQAFADAAPLATPVPLPTDRERRGRHRRMRAVRTVVTAKVVGIAALTLTAGGVAVAATGPSGTPAEERVSGGAVPSADAEPGADHTPAGRAPSAGQPSGSTGRTAACGPVTGAAIADLARDCGGPRDAGDAPDGHRVGPDTMAFDSPYAPRGGSTRSSETLLAAPPTTPPPTTPPTAPPTTAPPTTVPPPQAGNGSAGGGSGTPATEEPDTGSQSGSGSGSANGSSGSGPVGSGSSGSGQAGQGRDDTRDDATPRRGEATKNPAHAGDTRTPVTGRGAPPTP